jgi:sugar O-acyltransferase (sialic acid O-acetyltransferase NeuD family)
MKPVVIFGISDAARLAHYYFTRDTERAVAAFTVDASFRQADSFLERPLVAFEELPARYPPASHDMFVAIGYSRMNQGRATKYAEAKGKGYTLASYVSPRCTYLSQDPPGDNCFILEDNTVQPFVKIGSDVTLWSGNHIGHDSVIEDHVFVTSHVVVSGRVRVGAYCFLGVNAAIHNAVTLGQSTLVGAGAVIAHDTEESSVWLPRRSERLPRRSDAVNL